MSASENWQLAWVLQWTSTRQVCVHKFIWTMEASWHLDPAESELHQRKIIKVLAHAKRLQSCTQVSTVGPHEIVGRGMDACPSLGTEGRTTVTPRSREMSERT